jgi:pyridoxal phosphate enzyme (YggS family)
MLDEIVKNLETIRALIGAASQRGGHPPAKLIAVSKGQGVEKIQAAIDAGHRLFGENRVQEANEKWPSLINKSPDVELHLIGPLQTNKVKVAVSLFKSIETLDRLKLARALAKEINSSGKSPKLFIQVNTGEEPQKAGVFPADLPEFFNECTGLGLKVSGLMCIPPIDEEPAMHFALLKKLGGRLGLKEFSMGMSGDFEIASSLGATYVRVGTAIFGPRIRVSN